MKALKQNRGASFIAVALVYILATVVGVIVYRALDLEWWLSLLIADALATVATFIFSLIFKNASVYDPYWSVQPPCKTSEFAFNHHIHAKIVNKKERLVSIGNIDVILDALIDSEFPVGSTISFDVARLDY